MTNFDPSNFTPSQGFNSSFDPSLPPGVMPDANPDIPPGVFPPADPTPVATVQGQINYLLQQARGLVAQIESQIVQTVLPITADSSDQKLSLAHQVAWPIGAGNAPDYVSYPYYKSLKGKDSAAAKYIVYRFESAFQDLLGSNALEVLRVLNVIVLECGSVAGFITKYGLTVSDTAEQRITELIQEWVQAAVSHTGNFGTLFQTAGQTYQFSTSDIANVTSDQARQAQALFKVKVNLLNEQLQANLNNFEQNYSNFSDLFWTGVLGPALAFRQNITSAILPTTGLIGQEIKAAAGALDSNLSMQITDQLRRNMNFDQILADIQKQIQVRDTYRGYIKQLAQLGGPIASQGPGILQTKQIPPSETSFFSSYAPDIYLPEFDAPHGILADLSSDDHPQYLKKSGDNISGPMTLSDGVRIDGIVPHKHAHTGSDGSAQVDGASIIGGTLTSGSVSSSDSPVVPSGLQIIFQTIRGVPPNSFTVDAVVEWEGDNENTYELQLSPLP